MPTWSSGAAGAAGSTTPATSIPDSSGAASWIAPSMAIFTVSADDAQPSQLPSSRSRATPSVDAEVLDPAGVRAQVGPDPVERALDAAVHVQRVQLVQQQQALHQVVLGEPGDLRGVELRHDPLQTLAVHLDQEPDELLGGVPVRTGLHVVEELLDPLADRARVADHVSTRR